MAGITPLEGQDYIAELIYSQDVTASNLELGLFVNTTGVLTESSVWTDVTEASGTGYAEISLTAGSWTIASGGVATFAQQSWTATADWAADVYGYYIRTTEATPRILHFEYNPNGARAMATGNIYAVDLSTDTESV